MLCFSTRGALYPQGLSERCGSSCFLPNNLGKENVFKILNQADILCSRCNSERYKLNFLRHNFLRFLKVWAAFNPCHLQSHSPSLWPQTEEFRSQDPGPRRALTLLPANRPNARGFSSGRGLSTFIINRCFIQIKGRNAAFPAKSVKLDTLQTISSEINPEQ